MTNTKWILPVIVIAQFFCTSLWFAGNAIVAELVKEFDLGSSAIGHITSAVQFGFISGTLVYALLLIADRFPASAVFFCSALLAALSNSCLAFMNIDLAGIMALRFLTGFFLAGIYPVGMKIAADHFQKGLGLALGFLVGALVVGTAFPHLLKSFTAAFPWKTVLYCTSTLALLGGSLMLLVPEGAYRQRLQSLNFHDVLPVFNNSAFRSAALGYFGHMWELYAFWAFVPVILATYAGMHPEEQINIPGLSFVIIGSGGLACISAGYLSKFFGTKRTAFTALLLSGTCCLLSPFAFSLPLVPFLAFLVFWGLVVIADSPLFSTLVAQHAIAHVKGTAITMITCIGFFITIISIELLNQLVKAYNPQYIFLALATGPVLGLLFMWKGKNKTA